MKDDAKQKLEEVSPEETEPDEAQMEGEMGGEAGNSEDENPFIHIEFDGLNGANFTFQALRVSPWQMAEAAAHLHVQSERMINAFLTRREMEQMKKQQAVQRDEAQVKALAKQLQREKRRHA